MMTILRTCMLAIALSLTHSGIASAAALWDHTDVYNAGGVALGTGTDSQSWEFNLLTDGYNPSTESITSATVSISITEISSGGSYEAEAELTLGIGETNQFEWDVFTGTKTVTLTSLVTLDATGKLSATLEADDGAFTFDQATLAAHDVSAVPVPAAVWLFGSGLLSLAGFARARQKA